jgi:hypothetical protein
MALHSVASAADIYNQKTETYCSPRPRPSYLGASVGCISHRSVAALVSGALHYIVADAKILQTLESGNSGMGCW